MIQRINKYKGWTLDFPMYNADEVDNILNQMMDIMDAVECGYASDLRNKLSDLIAENIPDSDV